jgi:hypothetical protein
MTVMNCLANAACSNRRGGGQGQRGQGAHERDE